MTTLREAAEAILKDWDENRIIVEPGLFDALRAALAEEAATIHTSALRDVLEERRSQDAKWGEQNHDLGTWLAILMEEVGEASEAHLHCTFGGPKAGTVRKELVQVAAVALAIVECFDRNATPASGGQP